MNKQLDFVFFDAGGGHRAAATALEGIIRQQGRPWDVRLVNFQEILDPLDILLKLTGIRTQDVYNLLLKKGWTLGSPQLTVAMHLIIRIYHRSHVRLLREFWSKRTPDLVVSVIPNFSRALHESLKAVHPRTPLVTILTDMADYPPHFWMEPGLDQHWICGTAKACAQAVAMGYSQDRILRASGMVLHPRFYQPVEVDRNAERTRLGLAPDVPTGLIMFGGQGSKVIYSILERLEQAGLDAQYIAICGNNDGLRKRIAARKWRMPLHVEGFTREVPRFMAISDFLIGKPGPGSISEAIAMRLPVIVERNAWTLPQERYNAEWVKEHGVGIVLDDFRSIADAVHRMLADLDHLRGNTAKIENRAVFEIPEMLDRLARDATAPRT